MRTVSKQKTGQKKETIQKQIDSFFEEWEDELHEATDSEAKEALAYYLNSDSVEVYNILEKYI